MTKREAAFVADGSQEAVRSRAGSERTLTCVSECAQTATPRGAVTDAA